MNRMQRTIYTNIREAITPDRRRWIIEYELCCERTPAGREFLYIKGYERCYRCQQLLYEDLGLSPVLDTRPQQAIEVYTTICQADVPVSAMHITDIAQDMLLDVKDAADAGMQSFATGPVVRYASDLTTDRGI